MSRVVLHADANSYYAAIECLYTPSIRNFPVAVCGDPEARHGIVLTKNQHAKKFGVQTGEAIWQAKQKCPKLVVVPPDYELYLRYTKMLRGIFSDYSDKIEPFGLDESWIGLSESKMSMQEGKDIADELRDRVRNELGITLSVGVSFNKIFAKLGSDYKKPDATTVFTEDNYREKVWPLAVSDLLFVGPATTKKLRDYGIKTIGELAMADLDMLTHRFGKVGAMLQGYALGQDHSPVCPDELDVPVKSVGNSTTAPHDIATMDDAKCIFHLLAESVGTRLREHGFKSRCISISVRTPDLISNTCQRTIKPATNLTGEIAGTALSLFVERYAHRMPFRSVGIHCQDLMPETAPEQIDFFGDHEKRDRLLMLDRSIDNLKARFGPNTVHRGIVLADTLFRKVQPEDHIRPAAPFYGR